MRLSKADTYQSRILRRRAASLSGGGSVMLIHPKVLSITASDDHDDIQLGVEERLGVLCSESNICGRVMAANAIPVVLVE